jgi:hypothetical protein
MIRAKTTQRYPIIDLTGPQGNAYVLLGYAQYWGKELGINQDGIDTIVREMTSGDYEHLVQKFDDYFGEFVILER